MSKRTILYWGTTGLLSLLMAGGGVMDIVQPADFMAENQHLGYPAYVFTMLGVWKLLGVLAILVPGLPRLKEWAYAGFAFDVIGAVVSHVSVGDPVGNTVPALVATVLVYGSWRLRPATRRV